MKILVISSNYPSQQNPQSGIFVYNLIQNFVEEGHEVTVISCERRTKLRKKYIENYDDEKATVFRPSVISLSNKQILWYNTYSIGRRNKVFQVLKVVKKNKLDFDVVYSHFLSSALIAVEALSEFKKPFFVAVGEYYNIDIVRNYYKNRTYHFLLDKIKGFVAVSPQIKAKLLGLGISEKRILLEPNAVDLNKFQKFDKIKIRNKYNLPIEKKIVLFVGRFIENKGPLRVLAAIENLQKSVSCILIGKGEQNPNSERILFKGSIPNNKIPEFMSAADIFVLPTLHEGSSNVIVEAMACGLPIISSDIPEIRFQCNEEFSILVDPNNISEISCSIELLLSNRLKMKKMSDAAILNSKRFSLKERAKRILSFMDAE